MTEISLIGVLIVAAVAFVVPIALGLVPALRIPSVVVEIVAGIVIGPAVLGLVEVDAPLRFMALLGLAFLLFLAGIEIDLGGLLRGGAALAPVPVFLLALLLIRGLPAVLYRPTIDTKGVLAAALLQATSLPFIVATTGIGMDLGILSPATGAALVVAGLLSVVLFPLGALTLLRSSKRPSAE
jgi:Kef-type K+ transport system membrane component KefB